MTISLGNRAKMSTSTTGTGTITLGSAVSGFQTFADAGITNGQTVRYAIDDGANFEIGSGTYTSSGTTLTRSVTESSNSDSAISLSGSAEVFIAATVADLNPLYAANESSPQAQPSASGSNAVAIGDDAVASGERSFSAMLDSESSGTQSVAIGRNATSAGSLSSAFGYSATTGSSGAQAVALGRAYANGSYSFAAQIADHSSSYGAAGLNSVAIGNLAKATGEHSVALGKQNIASNHWAFVSGYENTGSGAYSATLGSGNTNSGAANFCVGYGSTADGDYGAAIGRTVSQRNQNHTLAFGLAGQPWTSGSTPDGASQTRITGYAKQTADATPLPMNGYTTNHAVNAENSFTLPNNAAATFSLTVIANVTGGGNSKAWKLEGAVKRGASASATALIGSVIKTTVAEDSGAANWDVSIAANTTIGGLVITCTGQASTSIRWVGRMDSTEVTY